MFTAIDNLTQGVVALRKESVDRNLAVWAIEHGYQLSLSARRAWIEMGFVDPDSDSLTVALRKESVDRNIPAGRYALLVNVALRKESVDRNSFRLLGLP